MGGEYLGFELLLSPNPPAPPTAFGSGRKRLFWEQHPCQKLWGSLDFGFLVEYCLLISSYSIFILFTFFFFKQNVSGHGFCTTPYEQLIIGKKVLRFQV